MSGFDAAWLDLRASADDAARDSDLLRKAADYVNDVERPLVVDLGCGVGSTVRVMAPLLFSPTRWRLVDSDPGLLALAEGRCAAAQVTTCLRDLATAEPLPVADARLVTASALFDLVSENWIDRLATQLEDAALYAGLIYDGRTDWSPRHRLDGEILAAFNRHQRTDKGFGPALGPQATAYLTEALGKGGFKVEIADSPWRLAPGSAALVTQLVQGIAGAVTEEGSVRASEIEEWRRFRLGCADTGRCLVGHYDLFAWPVQASAGRSKQLRSKVQSKMKSPPRS